MPPRPRKKAEPTEIDVQEVENKQGIIENIRKNINKGGKPIFKLSSPQNLTIKNRNGEFRRRDFIGGVEFYATDVYLGKSGKILLCMKPLAPSDFIHIEMEVAAASLVFDNLGKHLFDGGDFVYIDDPASTSKPASESYKDVPNFGSW